MDVITRLAFGEALGFLRTGSDVHGIIAQTRRSFRVLFVPLVVPWFRALIMSWPLSSVLLPQPTDANGSGVALR